MGWVCYRNHLLRPPVSGTYSNFQEIACRRLFRLIGLIASLRQCHHMADLRAAYVLCYEGVGWLGDAG